MAMQGTLSRVETPNCIETIQQICFVSKYWNFNNTLKLFYNKAIYNVLHSSQFKMCHLKMTQHNHAYDEYFESSGFLLFYFVIFILLYFIALHFDMNRNAGTTQPCIKFLFWVVRFLLARFVISILLYCIALHFEMCHLKMNHSAATTQPCIKWTFLVFRLFVVSFCCSYFA